MYNSNFRLWQAVNALPEDTIQRLIFQGEICELIKKRYPNAVVMFSTDRKGKCTHVGIYDVKLLLNERHTFKAGLQYAPQLISERMPWSDDWDNAYKLKYIYSLWATLGYAIVGDEEVKKKSNCLQ
jgi:hypothetical protein